MDDSTAASGTEPYRESAEAYTRGTQSGAGSRIQDERYRARLQAEERVYKDCAAVGERVAGQLHFVQEDFNRWTPTHEYDAVIANQALHHVLNLEHIFAEIQKCLKPQGSFIISDIIGRNGNQRWPEALDIVHEF